MWQFSEKVCVRFMVFNATFSNISVISWRSVLLAEETGIPGENHRQTLSHNFVSSTPHHERWWNSLITQVVVNPTTKRLRPPRSFFSEKDLSHWVLTMNLSLLTFVVILISMLYSGSVRYLLYFTFCQITVMISPLVGPLLVISRAYLISYPTQGLKIWNTTKDQKSHWPVPY